MFRLTSLMLLYILNVLTLSLGQESLSFSKDDWQVDCDNTRTCRATGYMHENGEDGASIMLVIEPGKESRIYGFARTIEDYKQPLTLYINDQNFGLLQSDGGSIEGEFLLLGTQIDRLLNSKTINFIELKNKSNTLKISPKGMTAVFLKIDEFQNRVNTPLALVKKGNQPVDQLKAYINPLVIKMGKVFQDQSVIDSVTKNISKFYPYLEKQFNVDSDEDSECWVAAYNFGDMYWGVDKNLKHIKRVESTYNSFEEGVLGLYMKGRGLGGCLSFEESVWDGNNIQLSSKESTGSCNAPTDGYWRIPIYVTEVIPYTEN